MFRPDISIMRIKELNFLLCLEIFMHFNRQLRASHLILGYVPSYTSYQDSSSILTVGSPLLSYLDVRLLGFLLQSLNSEEAKHLSPQIARHDSLEPIQDGSRDTIFQGRAVHIPLEASVLEDPAKGNPVCENTNIYNSTLLAQTIEIVQKRSMTLD